MKHPVYERHHGYGAEWLQAIFTLIVLATLYQYSLTFDSNPNGESGGESRNQTSSYWNDVIGYGFRGNDSDRYESATLGSALDRVSVSAGDNSLSIGTGVRVSFYTTTSIEDIEKNHTEMANKKYSRLPNGIAVIEGDLSSSRAKNILATLHAR